MIRYLALFAIVLPTLAVPASVDETSESLVMWNTVYQMQKSMLQVRKQLIEAEILTDEIILDDIQQQNLRGMKKPRKPVKPMTSEQCLTDNIYYEAASEPFAGKVAVAQVTMNRVADSFGGDTVCAVVYFKKINPNTGKKEAAFSWTLGSHWRARFISRTLYAECREIARQVLAGSLQSDIIGREVFWYHADYIKARWAKNVMPVAQIGHHVFYE
jgi:spore germination cell wall hydrolase CwlJ-like protein